MPKQAEVYWECLNLPSNIQFEDKRIDAESYRQVMYRSIIFCYQTPEHRFRANLFLFNTPHHTTSHKGHLDPKHHTRHQDQSQRKVRKSEGLLSSHAQTVKQTFASTLSHRFLCHQDAKDGDLLMMGGVVSLQKSQ
mmetsp:Transcript_34038/g.78476  ORF Transcript_34038/g.78476 Transcript_34038/m.78476 type:complete len:136 (+) Transcript_34038:662-1069(+)